ncbi:MAG: Mur ligase family protein, partial [Candidatus Absconditabacteria bacterium]
MKNKLLNYYYFILGKLAKRYIQRHKPEIIGITGSVGKTGLRAIIYTVLQKDLKNKIIYSSPKNFNGRFGFSLSILKIEDYSPGVLSLIAVFFVALYRSLFWGKKYNVIVLEYGIDEIGEMDFLLSIAKPNISIFTKIDKVHCMNFGSPDVTATEKFKLMENAKDVVILNYDDSYARSGYSKINVDKFFYSTQPEGKNVDIDFQDATLIEDNGRIYSKFNLRIKNKFLFVKTNLLSRESYGYTGVAILILDILSNKLNSVSFLQDHPGSEIH